MVSFDGRMVVLTLRIAQAFFAIIVFGVTAYVVTWWRHYWHQFSPSALNFLIFDAVWTLLALAYLIIVPWRFSDTRAHHKFGIFGMEAATMIFWLAGFLAVAVWLSGRPCWGSVCAAAKVSAVFGAFEWVCFVATSIMAGVYVFRTRDSMSGDGKGDASNNVME